MAKATKSKRPLNKLSSTFVVTTRDPGRHGDGGGLFLVVRSGGSRSWSFIYKRGGRSREMGLGAFDAKGERGLTLAEAREKAAGARITLRNGLDPLTAKRTAVPTGQQADKITFGEYARIWLATYSKNFKNPKTAKDWERSLEIHAASLLPMSIDAIAVHDVVNVLTPIWHSKRKTAREVRGRLEQVLEAATVLGKRNRPNPALWRGNLMTIFGKNKKKPKHHAAAHYDALPVIVKALRAAGTTAALATEYAIITASRTTETRAMRVSEVDFEEALWTVPAVRMKGGGGPHRVPLCAGALAILRSVIPTDAKPGDFVFQGLKPDRCLGENALLHALKAIAPDVTVHGCRSSFRDWAGDCTEFPREVAEAALAHAVGNEVEQAYRRGTALQKRRLLMNAWGAFLEGTSTVVDNVVPVIRPDAPDGTQEDQVGHGLDGSEAVYSYVPL